MTRRRRREFPKRSVFMLLVSGLSRAARHTARAATAEGRVPWYQHHQVPSSAGCRKAYCPSKWLSLEIDSLGHRCTEATPGVYHALANIGGGWRPWERNLSLSVLDLARKTAVLRGGESRPDWHGDDVADDSQEDVETDEESMKYDVQAVEWMLKQLCVYQTRIALISKPLVAKGYKLREIVPSPRGLICALSTEDRQMDCRMYVEAEVGKKVVAPCKCKGTQKWITFSALNSERRKEVAKWKDCPVCQGPIDYKLYESHGGEVGKVVSAILNNELATRGGIVVLLSLVCLTVGPLLNAIMVRVLTSGIYWQNYEYVRFLMHLPLPFNIMITRFLMKYTYNRLLVLESILRQWLTDVESRILEARIPVTVEIGESGNEVAIATPPS